MSSYLLSWVRLHKIEFSLRYHTYQLGLRRAHGDIKVLQERSFVI